MSVVGTSVVGGRLGLNLTITGLPDVEAALADYPRKIATVEKRAILTLQRRLPVQARRDIQAEYNISASRVRKDLGARVLGQGIRLTGYFRGIGLLNYGARQTDAGVTAAVFRGGARSLREGAFIATLRNGNRQVMKRKGKARLPIETQYGPTAAQMLRKGRRPERLLDFARGVLRAEVDRQLERLAAKAGTGANA